jgi:hypothetical protein
MARADHDLVCNLLRQVAGYDIRELATVKRIGRLPQHAAIFTCRSNDKASLDAGVLRAIDSLKLQGMPSP